MNIDKVLDKVMEQIEDAVEDALLQAHREGYVAGAFTDGLATGMDAAKLFNVEDEECLCGCGMTWAEEEEVDEGEEMNLLEILLLPILMRLEGIEEHVGLKYTGSNAS